MGRARRLVFGQMYEDVAVEAAVLPPGRVLCVASGGSTPLALAADGWQVTAVDVNPAQVDYARARLAGAPYTAGSADRLLGLARSTVRLAGWRRADMERFCALTSPQAQVTFCGNAWTPGVSGWSLRAMLSRASAGPAAIEPFTSVVPVGFDAAIRRRLYSGWTRHPNAGNPFANRLLLSCAAAGRGPVDRRAVRLECADLVDHLESGAPALFDGFSLSNVLDAAGPAYADRLMSAVRRAAAPGAVMVLRSFVGSDDPGARE